MHKENDISGKIIEISIQIHRELGPGLLESTYERILARELEKAGFRVERQVPIDIVYAGDRITEAYRADMIVEGLVVVEFKSVDRLADIHRKQAYTYVKLSGLRLGLLINFGGILLKDGIVRIVNRLLDEEI